jgi:hypothetical protein
MQNLRIGKQLRTLITIDFSSITNKTNYFFPLGYFGLLR